MAIGWIWIQSKSMLGSHVGIYQMQKDVNFPSGWTNWCRGPGILAGKDLSPRPGSAGCSLRLGKIRWNNLEYFHDFPRNFHQWMGNMMNMGISHGADDGQAMDFPKPTSHRSAIFLPWSSCHIVPPAGVWVVWRCLERLNSHSILKLGRILGRHESLFRCYIHLRFP